MSTKKIDRYEIIDELGRGGMATVFRAFDPRFKREIALKVLPRHYMHDLTFRARFEREAQTIATLEHPAIVSVYDFGYDDDQPFLVMRFMRGGSLVDRIKVGPLPVQQISEIFNRLAPALDNAHDHAIIHRDLKPQNILFDRWDKPYLADFGIVKLVEESVTDLTASGGAVGTPAYMSPEQVSGVDELDSRSDIYALGVIFFEMLTGILPYEARTPMSLALKHITEPVPTILDFDQSMPPESQIIIDRAMAKEREDRYPTASSLAKAISDLAKTVPAAPYIRPIAPAPVPPVPMVPTPSTADSLVNLEEDSEETQPADAVIADVAAAAAIAGPVDSDTPTALDKAPVSPYQAEDSTELVSVQSTFPWKRILLVLMGIAVVFAAYLVIAYSQDLIPFASTSTPSAAAVAAPIIRTNTPTSTTGSPTQTMESSVTVELVELILSPTSTSTLEPTHTATPTPTASNTPTPERLFRVLFSSVNVRNGPGTLYDSEGFLYEGNQVSVIGRTSDGSWINVVLPDGQTAWISSTVGELSDEREPLSIPIAATIPPPPRREPTSTPTPIPRATAVPYGANFTWIDPFQIAEQERQLASVRILEPISLWASALVLIIWLYWWFKTHVNVNGLFNNWQLVKRLTRLMTEVLLALLLLWFFFAVG